MNRHLDLDDFEEDDFPPELQSQLDRLEHSHRYREQDPARIRGRKLAVKRRLEDWRDARRLRDEIDYIH